MLKVKSERDKKKIRVRKKINGTAERPRVSVFRSLNQIYGQLVDDVNNVTLLSASSLSKDIEKELTSAKTKVEKSKVVGMLIAKKSIEKGIKEVVFDRGPYKYHGRVKALAEGLREGGLKV